MNNTDRNIKISLNDIFEMEKKLNDDFIYPCTIVQDRYGGTYSKASWLAFNREPDKIPYAIGGSDTEEMDFWEGIEYGYEWMGKGNTPNEAVLDLREKLENNFMPKKPETKLYEVWSEGYAATGERSGAICHTVIGADYMHGNMGKPCKTRARSFIEACELTLGKNLDRESDGSLSLSKQYILTQDGLIRVPKIWACRLFDNEQRARKSFG
jgi:hypothetical protein